MSNNILLGKEGEDRAAAYLENNGYEVIARNYRYKRAEIDLIARKGNTLVFAEVKLRNSAKYGLPEEAVDSRKADLIMEAAENYIFEIDWSGEIRFDIIAIKGKNDIRHFEDCFS